MALNTEHDNVEFTEEELNGVVIPDDEWEEGVGGLSLLLVGQVMGRRPIHWDNFTSLVSKLWSSTLGVEVKRLSKDNRFLFSFKHIKDKLRALQGGPWHYNKHLIILGEVPMIGSPELMELRLTVCDFHVRVKGLPWGRTSWKIAECVGNTIGEFRDVDLNVDGSNPHAYLRIRVGINVEKPIPRVTDHISSSKGEQIQLSLSYEKLPNFCYFCGVMGHTVKDCPCQYEVEGDIVNAPRRYGEWMRAGN